MFLTIRELSLRYTRAIHRVDVSQNRAKPDTNPAQRGRMCFLSLLGKKRVENRQRYSTGVIR